MSIRNITTSEFEKAVASGVTLAQIKAKRYHEKFLSSGKRVTLLGMNFSSESAPSTTGWARSWRESPPSCLAVLLLLSKMHRAEVQLTGMCQMVEFFRK